MAVLNASRIWRRRASSARWILWRSSSARWCLAAWPADRAVSAVASTSNVSASASFGCVTYTPASLRSEANQATSPAGSIGVELTRLRTPST